MLGYLAMDMYLPAFGAMGEQLQIGAGAVGASLSIFLAGFALGQLLWGPLSDRLGRKPILLAGLSLFVLGCAGMFWVETAPQLLALRFMQAIGVCSAAVSWQALVIDRYPADKAHRVFASIMPLMSLSPALAPLLGAMVLNHFGWQAIFGVLLGVSLLLLLPTLFLRSVPKRQLPQRPATLSGQDAVAVVAAGLLHQHGGVVPGRDIDRTDPDHPVDSVLSDGTGQRCQLPHRRRECADAFCGKLRQGGGTAKHPATGSVLSQQPVGVVDDRATAADYRDRDVGDCAVGGVGLLVGAAEVG
ncbi:hypothetical protein BHE74_00000173 [Ensete ventricosum]|nr:hypothetical protein BHE74_00000173 [Ensete ventricosum]